MPVVKKNRSLNAPSLDAGHDAGAAPPTPRRAYATLRAACLAFLLSLSLLKQAPAHESDQYTLPVGRDFADLGPYLSKIVYGAIVDATAQTNAAIGAAIAGGQSARQVAYLQSADYIAGKVWASLFAAIPTNELLDATLQTEAVQAQYPGLVTVYRPRVAIYDDPLLVIDLTKFVRTFFRAGTVNVDGVTFGTDKLIHFINVGRIYHAKYVSRAEGGLPEAGAVQSAIASTARNKMISEDGFLGMWTTGIHSNGDLAADYAGLHFYRNLTETVRLGPRTLPPMLLRDGPYWRVQIAADSTFFNAFISPHWNEVLNPNKYLRYTAGRIRELIGKRCADVLDRYRDEHGQVRSRAQFEEIERALSTYHGVNYGHKSDSRYPVSIAAACLPAATTDQTAAPAAQAAQPTLAGADAYGRTALWWAARRGDAGQVRELASAGVDAEDVDGETPLHAAVRAGSVAAARELLAHGADPNHAALYSVTPLMLASAVGPADVAVLLLESGADPNRRDLFGRTPLHDAARRGNGPLARALLDHGADPRIADEAGFTPAQIAVRYGNDDVAALLAVAAPEAEPGQIVGRVARAAALRAPDGGAEQVVTAAPAPTHASSGSMASTADDSGRDRAAALGHER